MATPALTPPATARTVVVRPLAPEEYSRLAGLPFTSVIGIPDPQLCSVLVAENSAGEIVGLWSAMPVVHLEGLWVREDYRKTTVLGRLHRQMRVLLGQLGVRSCFTYVEDPDVLIIALKAGFQRLRGDLLYLELPAAEPVPVPAPAASPVEGAA